METKPVRMPEDLKNAFKGDWTDGTAVDEAAHIREVRKEYERIDRDWLTLHYKTSVVLALSALIVECVLALVFTHSDLLTTMVPRYIWKYIAVPGGCNLLLIGIDTAVMRSARLSGKHKAYIISLVLVGICFVLFTVHSIFTAAYYTFTIAILLTTVYADYQITWVTELVSLISLTISELFITWDVDKASVYKDALRMGDFLTALAVLTGFSFMCLVVIRFMRKKNEASIQVEIERHRLLHRLQMDELTNIFSRQAMHTAMKDLEAVSDDQTVLLAIVDLDHFKGINDRWGHHLGDRCLIEFAKILRENCGEYLPFRYGGDEFCLLFWDTGIEQARETCAQLQKKARALRIEEEPALTLTVSIGIAEHKGRTDGVRLFTNADRALYEAKKDRDTLYIFREMPDMEVQMERHCADPADSV